MSDASRPVSRPAAGPTTRAGADDAKARDLAPDTVAPGEHLTTNQGLRVADDQNSLKAGVRGPTLLEDFHFREKITHFDHERIPERVVHARGVAAHGYFQPYKSHAALTKAGLFQDPGKRTPVFVRFSTVAGSRGSADTPRDVRGFAVKFYTDEGVWDLVGNNIPVFFIQDAIKFPDLIHAVKPEPHNEVPQAASAHDTFYDFISLTPESTHMLLWVMSDRTLPRSLATMQGFGIHTFRFVNARGESRFVKFHFKPAKGVHSLVWDESQKVAGKDADFHRRDLWEAIERGDYPAWEMGVQVVEEADEHKFDFDLLDPTKIIPEEQVPVTPLGKLVLDRNPDNYFAETEQVAFHPGHVVPGIDFSNDPLLQGRLFSYLDTQLKRVGPNFAELPINRPTCPVSNNQRDAQARQRIDKGRVAYFPNSLAKGCPMQSPDAAAFVSVAEKVETKEIRERYVNEVLVNVSAELAHNVAQNIGMTVTGKATAKAHDKKSPALSMADQPAAGIKGRKVAILAADGVDGGQVAAVKAALAAEGALADVIAKTAGAVRAADGAAVAVDKPAPNAASVLYDAVFVPGGRAGADALAKSGHAVHFVSEAYAHGKPVAAAGEGADMLARAGVEVPAAAAGSPVGSAHGVVVGPAGGDVAALARAFVAAIAKHRHFDRATEALPA